MKRIFIFISGLFALISDAFAVKPANAFNGLNELERHAFNSFSGNNFDPNNFDPDAFNYANGQATRKGVAAPLGQGGQFTITVVNGQAGAVTVELFQFIKSITNANNPQVSALNPFTALDVAAANAQGLVFFDRSGNLVYRNAAPADCTISCKQIPYKSLFIASGLYPLVIDRMRVNVTTDAQIENDITHVTNTFLGLVKRNSISPRSFFSPNQFQTKTIDIPVNFDITAEKGIETIVNAGETITYNIFLRAFNKPAV